MKNILVKNHNGFTTYGVVNMNFKNTKRLYNTLLNKYNSVDISNIYQNFSNDNYNGYFICK